MFKYRFKTILQLRENERDAARAQVAEAFEALRQISIRREAIAAELKGLGNESGQRRLGTLSMDRLLSDGRYERQLAAEDSQAVAAAEKIEQELRRRQQVLSAANASVRQMEILRDKDRESWDFHQAKIAQDQMDEIAARRQRSGNRGSSESDHENRIYEQDDEPNHHPQRTNQ
jgi:flagellar export protein FliJ